MVNNVRVLNIRECLVHDSGDVLGEDEIQNILSDFYCELNPDVERFLKEQAVDFTKIIASKDLLRRMWKEMMESSIL